MVKATPWLRDETSFEKRCSYSPPSDSTAPHSSQDAASVAVAGTSSPPFALASTPSVAGGSPL